jgi:hypothetical protein
VATNGGNFALAGFSLAVSTAETGTHLIAFRSWAGCTTTGTSESEFVVHIAWLVRVPRTSFPTRPLLHPPQAIMTAAKILSGRTKDQNVG